MTSTLIISVGGKLWWEGFTAELTFSNSSNEAVSEWSYSFSTPHTIEGLPWGVTSSAEPLANGDTKYTLKGTGWAQTIPAGGSVTIGFNAKQGTPLGNEGSLSAELLMTAASATFATSELTSDFASESSVPEPDPQPVEMQGDEQSGHDSEMGGMHAHTHSDSAYTLITEWGSSNGSQHTSHDELMGGRTPISTEAHIAYNHLRSFLGLGSASLEDVGNWAFSNNLTNNSQAWGDDLQGVGLWYSMQGAKVGWIADKHYDPQWLADLQRTARLGEADDVVALARQIEKPGFIDHLEEIGGLDNFINTLKMEPHFGGWMHDKAHGWLSIENVAIAHDINHLTVLSHDQAQPFMNDTFDWPQWQALEVSNQTVIDYFQSMVSLSEPLGGAIGDESSPTINQITNETTPTIDGYDDSEVDVLIGGSRWWNGFTAELVISNKGYSDIDGWALTFDSTHEISGDPWGADVSSMDLMNGTKRYKVVGSEWGEQIEAGGSVSIGFNGIQGTAIGNEGDLTAEQLFSLPNGNESPPWAIEILA